MQAGQGQLVRRKSSAQRGSQSIPPGLVGHALPGKMPGKVALADEAGQGLLFKPADGAGIDPVLCPPGGQQLPGQHHVSDADAGGQTAGTGGEVDHRAVGPGHALQAGQGAGIKAELRIVIVLYDIPLARAAGCPVEQLRAAARRHGHARGELVAGRDIAHRRARARQCLNRKAVRIHRQAAARHAVVFQHLLRALVAGVFHRRFAGQERGQQAQQILHTGTHHHLLGGAPHAPVFLQIVRQRLPQFHIPLRIAMGQQLGRGIEQLFLQPGPGAEREQPRVHAPGGQIEPDGGLGCFRRSSRHRGRHFLGPGGQGKIFLYIKAAALPRLHVALGRQDLICRVHRVDRHRQLCRQPPLAGHPGARRNGPAAHLGGKALIELLVQRHPAGGIQCSCQMKHKTSPLFGCFAELTP